MDKLNIILIKMGIGDWGLGIGDWGLGIGPNPQSPIPIHKKNFQLKNKIKILIYKLFKYKYLIYLIS